MLEKSQKQNKKTQRIQWQKMGRKKQNKTKTANAVAEDMKYIKISDAKFNLTEGKANKERKNNSIFPQRPMQ